jgi:hypothetical protein
VILPGHVILRMTEFSICNHKPYEQRFVDSLTTNDPGARRCGFACPNDCVYFARALHYILALNASVMIPNKLIFSQWWPATPAAENIWQLYIRIRRALHATISESVNTTNTVSIKLVFL